jgi:hypothetical protein
VTKILPLCHVDIGLLANQVGETTTDTLDGSQGVHNLSLTVDVRVEETENVLELVLIWDDDRLIIILELDGYTSIERYIYNLI